MLMAGGVEMSATIRVPILSPVTVLPAYRV